MKTRWLWAYLLLGPAFAWLSHLMITYSVGESACIIEGTYFTFLGMGSAGWALSALSLICFLICACAFVLASRNPGPEVNQKYISKFGFYSSLLFMIAVLAQSVPIFILLNGC